MTPTSPVTPAAPSAPAGVEVRFAVSRIDQRTRQLMTGRSWRPGCPVGPRQLRLLTVSYHRYPDGAVRTGRLMVHRRVARPVLRVFRKLLDAGFPIRRMRLVDRYGGSDARSIAANNTSAFNCRRLPSSSRWSEHAYGTAVDINPVQNPYWIPETGYVEPAAGRAFIDRGRRNRAMIRPGGPVVAAFTGIGWSWGGWWSSPRDWQHFSATGR